MSVREDAKRLVVQGCLISVVCMVAAIACLYRGEDYDLVFGSVALFVGAFVPGMNLMHYRWCSVLGYWPRKKS